MNKLSEKRTKQYKGVEYEGVILFQQKRKMFLKSDPLYEKYQNIIQNQQYLIQVAEHLQIEGIDWDISCMC